MTRVLVMGIGNELRGDDAAGPCVADYLKPLHMKNVSVMKSQGYGVELLEVWGDAEMVILIDAASSGKAPGTLFFLDLAKALPDWNLHALSSHDLGLPQTIELAKALRRLPERIYLCAIEGRSFKQGSALSPEVQSSLKDAADWVCEMALSASDPTLRGNGFLKKRLDSIDQR